MTIGKATTWLGIGVASITVIATLISVGAFKQQACDAGDTAKRAIVLAAENRTEFRAEIKSLRDAQAVQNAAIMREFDAVQKSLERIDGKLQGHP